MSEIGKIENIPGISFDAAITAFSVKKEQNMTITKFTVEAPLSPEQTRSIHRLMYCLSTIVIAESPESHRLRVKNIPGQIEWAPEDALAQ